MDISVGHYFTVRSAKIIKEIGLVFPENEETWQGLHHTLASLTPLQFSSNSTLKFKGRYISYNLRKIIPTQGWSGDRLTVFFAFLRRDNTCFLRTGSLVIEHKIGGKKIMNRLNECWHRNKGK